MQFEGVAIVLGVLGLLSAVIALRLLFSFKWFAGWLRGNLGIFFALFAAALVLVIQDVRTYRSVEIDKPVATVSLEQKGEQLFEIVFVDSTGTEMRRMLRGDTWSLSANLYNWSPRLSSLGLKPGYRINRIVGKYFSITLERSNPPEPIEVSTSEYLDFWGFLHQYGSGPFVSTVDARVTPQPMADGALYEVVSTGASFTVKPVNEAARIAVSAWQ